MGTALLLFLGLADVGVLAADGDRAVLPVDRHGDASIAPIDHVSVGKVQEYADENIDADIFASIHLEWENERMLVVLSVTEPLRDEQQLALQQLVQEPAELKIRIVDYSAEELYRKQAEIDMRAFEYQGVKIWYVGVNVFDNRLEIGIDPFNEDTAQLVYDQYGEDMITVVEGHEVKTLHLPVSSGEEPRMDLAVDGEFEAEKTGDGESMDTIAPRGSSSKGKEPVELLLAFFNVFSHLHLKICFVFRVQGSHMLHFFQTVCNGIWQTSDIINL
ncbi:hypothetical protein J2S00_001236 [Caldalkalibacillus uzonensis]|uniref:Uncharacterized protein n=1 Tax=Caldalkalibacillus uzonensis TaxID=353224 RepID=A0ABU0CPW9_9BACI|nr:hypothetical protein [Caldalkalibacillus uzonensis]